MQTGEQVTLIFALFTAVITLVIVIYYKFCKPSKSIHKLQIGFTKVSIVPATRLRFRALRVIRHSRRECEREQTTATLRENRCDVKPVCVQCSRAPLHLGSAVVRVILIRFLGSIAPMTSLPQFQTGEIITFYMLGFTILMTVSVVVYYKYVAQNVSGRSVNGFMCRSGRSRPIKSD